MNNHKELTDRDINRLVAKKLGVFDYICDDSDSKSAVLCDSGASCRSFDWCKNPTDAWRIIEESKIGLWPPDQRRNGITEWIAFCEPEQEHPLHHTEKMASHKNPLRAAMIVYLNMEFVSG